MAVQRSVQEQKFDRQIRLWGPHGQRALETTHVAVIGSSAVAAETLKNLCLANLHAFTIIDDHIVNASDVGNNFFVEHSSIGQPRAQQVTEFLLEMNADVKGQALVQNAVELIQTNIQHFTQYSMIIATNLSNAEALCNLANLAYQYRIPFMIVRSIGFMGYLRLAVPEHNIVETKPDKDLSDLYLHPEQLTLFPELAAFIQSFDLSAMPSHEHSHVPYAVILGQVIQQFVQQYGHAPSNTAEQNTFREMIKATSLDYSREANFAEAVQYAFKAYNRPRISDDVNAVLRSPATRNLTNSSDQFWIVARAIADWVDLPTGGNASFLPVSPDIPDMHADSNSYIELKRVYHNKYLSILHWVQNQVNTILQSLGLAPDAISMEYIENMVKNVRTMMTITYRSIADEITPASAQKENITEAFEPPFDESAASEENADIEPQLKPVNIQWYFALRAVDLFYTQHHRLPGGHADDADILFTLAKSILAGLGIAQSLHYECCQEICRWNGCELHNISAFMGGIAAQEATKLIVKQFVPINNTYVFDGIFAKAETWEL